MASGDEGAFRELLARYRSTVYATVYAVLIDPESVDAVVADTFREARRMAGAFLTTQGSVSGWLTHLARLCLAGQLGPPAVSSFGVVRMKSDRVSR